MNAEALDAEYLAEWADVVDDSTYYELLGVLDLADTDAIKVAFHEFALAFHPDVHRGRSADEVHAVLIVYQRGAEAYRVLSDPALRARYDLDLARGRLRLADDEEPATDAAPNGPALKSLEDLCQSPAARLCARKADEHISRGELAEARRLLRDALTQDGFENLELEERIEALDLMLYAIGS
jgi:curved DNA-binding protein CbpA